MAFQALNDKVVLEIPKEALGFYSKNDITGETKWIEYPSPKLDKCALEVLSVGENVPPSIKVGDKIMTFKEHVTLVPIESTLYILLQWFDIDLKIE